MISEQPFVSSQLTLKDLSEATGIPANSISQAVNKITGKSVVDFINKFRVDLLKEKIANPRNKNFKLMILASECGFISKSTLNRIFKQHTGQTPGEYYNNTHS